MAMEDIEYGKRKVEAIVITIIGIILTFPVSIIIGSYTMNFWVFLFLVIIGLMIVAYGSYYWHKVTHIVWTKQAIREYEERKLAAIQGYHHVTSSRKCPSCGAPVAPDDIFCSQCGCRISDEGKR